MIRPRALADLLRSLHVKESRAEILADPNWPRTPRGLTDIVKWQERDARVEREMASGVAQKVAA